MATVEKIVGVMLALIALYLVLANSRQFNEAIGSLGKFQLSAIGALQGRMIDAYGVQLGKNSITGGEFTSVDVSFPTR